MLERASLQHSHYIFLVMQNYIHEQVLTLKIVRVKSNALEVHVDPESDVPFIKH